MNTNRGRNPHKAVPFTILAVSILLACFAFVLSPKASAVPSTMNFQGRLADASGTIVPDGLYNMQFKLFTVSSGGSNVWNETRETTNRVQVTNGLFSTKLGEVTPISASLFASGSLYFEITLATPGTATCNTSSCASWESPMTPRHQMSTSAYAFNSDTLDGLDSTAFAAATGSAAYIQNGTSPQTADFNITGTGTAATLQAATLDRANAGALTIGGTNATSIALSDNTTVNANLTVSAGNSLTLAGGTTASRPGSPVEGMVYYDTDTKQLLTYANGKWQADRSDAVLVAASNSSASDKAAADYIADGDTVAAADGDQVQINSALTAATGKKVVLLKGTYTVDDTILVPDNTTITGLGTGTVVEFSDIDVTDYIFQNTNTTSGQNIAIKDMKLDGRNDLNLSGSQSAIYFNDMGTAGSNLAGAIVSNVEMTRFRGVAALIDSSDNNRFVGNKFISNTNDGLSLYNSSGFNMIVDNIATNNGGGVAYSIAGNNNTISGNTVRNQLSGYGIQITGDYNTATANILDNNISGLQVQGNKITLSDNIIRSSSDRGIGVISSTYVSITNNSIETSSQEGIEFYSTSDSSISGNTITNGDLHGVLIGGTVGTPSPRNTVSDNIIYSNGAGGAYHSIFVETYANDSKITGNKITDTAGSGYAISIGATGVSNTYLSDNVFSGTGATTINDAGTNTIYANQSKTAGGLDVLYKQAASTSAFQIQNASAATMFTADSTNTLIQIGSSTTDATGFVLALDSYNQAGDPTGVAGGMYYNTNTSKFRCYQAGAWTDCIGAGGSGANTTLSNLGATNINAALNTTAGNLTLQTTTSGNIILNAAGTTELQDDTNVGGNLTVAATKSLTLVGGNTGSRPAGSDGMMYYDQDTDQMLVYTLGKWKAEGADAILVAASNSSAADKAAADYIADGTGDQAEINSALTSADPAGSGRKNGKVYLFAGTYTVNATISLPNNTTLSGAGDGTIITIPNAFNTSDVLIENTDQTTGTGVTIRDLKINGNLANQSTGNQRGIALYSMGGGTAQTARPGGIITGVTITGTNDAGLTIQSSDHNIITANKFVDNAYNMYVTTSATYNTISNNWITGSDPGGYGLWLDSGASFTTLTGNVFQGNGNGLVLYGSSNNITGNTFNGNVSEGIYIANGSLNTISNNNISDNGGATTNDGIKLSASDSNSITDNKITDTGCSSTCRAIDISNSTSDTNFLSGNTFSTTSGTAVIRDLGTGTIYNGQSVTAGGVSATFKQAASATAFQIQNASAVSVLNVDTSTNNITLGAATTLTITGGTTGSRPTGSDGMMYYDQDTDQMLVFTGGKWKAEGTEAVLVAASNSSAADKAAADWIATGTGDQSQINSALTAADPAGSARKNGKVYLFPGTYTISAAISIPNNTTLAGAGNATVITVPNTQNGTYLMVTNTDRVTGTGSTLRDLKIDGNKANQSSGFMTAIDWDDMGGGTGGSFRDGGLISGVYVSNIYGAGMSLTSNNNTVVDGNTIAYTTSDGLYMSGNDNAITNNIVKGNDINMNLQSLNKTVVSGNVVKDGTTYGLYLSALVTNSTISNNTIGGNAGGLAITGSSNYNSVTGNTVQANTSYGILLGGVSIYNTVSGNTVHDNGGATTNEGIVVTNSDFSNILDNTITDTSCSTNCYAIDISVSTSDVNYLAGNVFKTSSGTATINDAGTGTIYAGQSMTQGGLDIRFKQSASTAAVNIQNASGVNVLNVDTTNGELELGSYNGGVNAVGGKIVFGTTTNANAVTLISAAQTGGSYTLSIPNLTGTDTICTVTVNNCVGTGATTTLNNIGSTNLSAALNTTSGNLTLQTTTSGNIILNAVGTTELQDDTNVGGNLTIATGKYIKITGDTTVNRPAGTDGMLYYDQDTDQLLTFTSGKWKADGVEAVLVAASNSSAADKAAADYIADGNTGAALDGDQVQINDAITAADPAGSGRKTGRVVLLAGTYTVDAAVSVKNNTTLAGVGNGTVITIPNTFNTTMNVITNTDATTGTGVVIRDLKLDGNKVNQSSGTNHGIYLDNMGDSSGATAVRGAEVSGVFITSFRTTGIYLNSSNNNTLGNNVIFDSGGSGIAVVGSSYNTVTANQSHDNGAGINVSGTSTYNTFSSNETIANTGNGFAISGINVLYNTFSANVSNSNTSASGFSVNASSNVFTGNTANGNDTGFTFDSYDQNQMTGNLIDSNATNGIVLLYSYGNIISDNRISNTGSEGIYITGSAGSVSNNNTITDNKVENSGGATLNNGIYVAGTDADNNIITNNEITDTSCSTNCYAINLTVSTIDNTYLSGNVFSTTSGTATIRDIGTGTRYVGQTKTAGGLDVLYKQAASTTAFQIQNAAGASLLTADSSTTINRIQTGNSTTDATAIFFMLDRWNSGTDPSATVADVGAMYYNTNTDKFRCYEGSAWADCVGANKALSNLTTTAINQSLIAGTTNSIDLGSSSTTWRAGYFGTSLSSPIIRPAADGTTAFKIQNAAGTIDYWTLDTTNNRILLGTSDTTGVLLVLDTKTGSGDPTGVDGGMYYNSNMSRFRCYEGGAWRNCTGASAVSVSTATQSPTLGSDTYVTGSSVPLPAGGMQGPTGSAQNGTLITWKVLISKTGGTTAHTFNIRFGTAGTTADTARCTAFSTGTGTAVADVAVVTITAYATAGGSATTLNCSGNLTHTLSTTGFSTAQMVTAYSTAASFDSTTASTKAGLSLNSPAASGAVIQNVQVTTTGL